MKAQMILHCGGKPATLEDLRTVPLPEETQSYKPVSHFDLVSHIERVASVLLKDYTFDKGIYALAQNGQRMFGCHVYDTDTSDLGLSIAFRNSYNRTMSIGIALGGSVMVCDNLALTGDITVMHKHTVNVIEDLEIAILRVVYKAESTFTQIVESQRKMQAVPLGNDDAFRHLGLLFGRGILTPRQLPVAKREWLTPSFSEFKDRNYWSFFNSVTAALKSTPPNRILERHLNLHDWVVGSL